MSDDEDALAWGVIVVPACDLHRLGVEVALDLIPEGSCIDPDALDPVLVPGVIGRTPGG
ncbi:hypothetical protein [Labrys sp. KNU-23]|uniref:hypothetical protein n=1 Tax=Labrys sp. KNU-23 TaxID=2789216 RepID=UPI00165B3ACE|nr:hypothetical protein [Labrys sp. KNU-23]